MSRRETPYDFTWDDGGYQPVDNRRADTEMESLMCGSDDTPVSALLALREVLVDAIDTVLCDRERWVFDAVVIERLAYREVGRRMGLSKSQVLNIKKQAVRKLRVALADVPAVREFLEDR